MAITLQNKVITAEDLTADGFIEIKKVGTLYSFVYLYQLLDGSSDVIEDVPERRLAFSCETADLPEGLATALSAVYTYLYETAAAAEDMVDEGE